MDYNNYFEVRSSLIHVSSFCLISILLFLLISCTSIDPQKISETKLDENIIEDSYISEEDPFENLPCVIKCNLTPTPLNDENEQNSSTKLQCKDCKIINVIRVIDGDTVETEEGVVRFFSIDTPENGEKCFKESVQRTKKLILKDTNPPFIGSIRVEKSIRLKDSFDRLLFYVYTLEGDSIGEVLIKEGLAKPWTKDGHHLEHFLELQSLYLDNYPTCF